MLGCLVNCFSCDVLHVCQNMNNFSWVFSSRLPAALSYLLLFHLAAGRARSPWKGREDGSGGACAPRHAKQCPFALGSTHLHLGGGCFCLLDLLLFLFPSAPWAGKQGRKQLTVRNVSYGRSPGFVPLWFMSAFNCCVGNEESLQRELAVTQGGGPVELAGLRGAKGLQCKLGLVRDLFMYLRSSWVLL